MNKRLSVVSEASAGASSEHDMVYMGKTLRLQVESHHRGLILKYMIKMKVCECIPSFLSTMMSSQDQEVENEAMACSVELRWWDKAIGRSLESKAMRVLKKMKKEIKSASDREDKASKVRELLGVSNG